MYINASRDGGRSKVTDMGEEADACGRRDQSCTTKALKAKYARVS